MKSTKKSCQFFKRTEGLHLSEIGKKVGLSHVSVRKRLRSLCRNLVKVSAELNAEQLGFRVAIINTEVESAERL